MIHFGKRPMSWFICWFRMGRPTRDPIGFKIKHYDDRLFSERQGYTKGFKIGHIWITIYTGKERS